MASVLLLLLLLLASATSANYVIFSQRFTADPAPLVHDGRVYLYTSHDKDHNHGLVQLTRAYRYPEPRRTP